MKKFISVLLAAITMFFGFSLTSCGGKIKGKIDAPTETVLAELGSYPIPVYEVVDENGMVLSGYTVSVKSIKDPDGNDVKQAYNSITVETAGVYTFVYTTGTKDVADVTVKVDFADRTAPTITIDENAIPAFFMTGNTYKVPVYTINGEPDASKCYTKVLHTDADGKSEKEVEIVQGAFEAKEKTGKYLIWIHVEDAAGNFNDYKDARSVDGPAAVEPDTVLYFDDEFGERQVVPSEEAYSGEFVSKKNGAVVHGDDEGSFKVTFNNKPTLNSEAYFNIKNPAITDVSGYDYLEMWVYNDNDFKASFGSTWWNDTVLAPKTWTRITWSVKNWGNNCDESEKRVPTTNIIGMRLRFMGFLDFPDGTFYLSPMVGCYGASLDTTVADLGYESGASRMEVWDSDAYTGKFSTEKSYGTDPGSYKVTMTSAPKTNHEIYLRVKSPVSKDVSAYDYLVLYVYNANNYNAKIGTRWFADQMLVANSWNRVKYPVSMFIEQNIFDVANEKPGMMLRPHDITGFTIRIFDLGENTEGTFYLSTFVVASESEVENGFSAPGKVKLYAFDEEAPADGSDGYVSKKSDTPDADKVTLTRATDRVYNNEKASTKITYNISGKNDLYDYFVFGMPLQNACFDKLVFAVYNDTNQDFYIGFCWGGDKLCKKGEWTYIEYDISDAGNILTYNALGKQVLIPFNGARFRIQAAEKSAGSDSPLPFEAGSSIYLSAIYGFNIIG